MHDPSPDDLHPGSRPPPAPPVIPYATPQGLGVRDNYGCWARGNTVIIAKAGGVMPPFCFKCGSPATCQKHRRFYWHSPLIYLLLLVGLIPYAIVAMCVQERANLRIPLCDDCRRRRLRRMLIAWLLFFAGAGLLVLGCAGVTSSRSSDTGGPLTVLGGIFTLITAALVGMYGGRIGYAREIDRTYAYLGGAGSGFLNQLPGA